MTDLHASANNVASRCAEAGLAVRAVDQLGGLLVLRPASFDDFPATDALRALASELGNEPDVRWVVLDPDGAAETPRTLSRTSSTKVGRPISPEIAAKRDAIVDEMRAFDQIVVAFSGGVDSTLVAALAFEALGTNARAVTAVSETLGQRELDDACRIATEIGIQHELVKFSELSDERFVENTSARCFFCQSMRFDQLRELADELDCDVLASGTNLDDTSDHRPGLQAMEQRRVYQPLLEHQLTKSDVREMARAVGLSAWDKPAKACLSSRIPHGLSVTHDRLRRIERAEDALEDFGFHEFRVRDHDGVARVEVAPSELDTVMQNLGIVARLIRESGFEQVSIDLVGYRSGSLNE